jgi:hypothetical protein
VSGSSEGHIGLSNLTIFASQTPQSRLTASLKGLLPDKQTLPKILEYTGRFTNNWTCWPLALLSYQQQENEFLPVQTVTLFDAGFPKDIESALSFVDKSMQSPNPGVVSKCTVWLCLSFKELPWKFKKQGGVRAPLLESSILIDNCIAKVEALYQASSTPVCNIDFVQALILQNELFLSIGRPTKAWKCIRAGIENAMLLGVHHGRSNLDRGIWEELWIRDRQLSLFLGMPQAVPAQLSPKIIAEKCSMTEKEIFRKIATVSGLIISRNQMKDDCPSSTITRTLQEMKELGAMIPEHWTKGHSRYISCLPQAFTHANIKIFHHTLELMINWPYCQVPIDAISLEAGKEIDDFEMSRKSTVEAAVEILKAHQDMRTLEVEPHVVMRADFLDFLAFKAALVMAAALECKRTPFLDDVKQRCWKLIAELADRLGAAAKAFGNAFTKQAALTLNILHGAREGEMIWSGTYRVTIPYFGRLEISEVFKVAQLITRNRKESRPRKMIVKMESNHVTSGLPYEHVPELELEADWTAVESIRTMDMEYGWKGVFEFDCVNQVAGF